MSTKSFYIGTDHDVGFVNERIPAEDKSRLNLQRYTGWTIDRARDLWMVAEHGGGPEWRIPFRMHRYSDGQQVANFVAKVGSTSDKKARLYCIQQLNIALHLGRETDAIAQWIADALTQEAFSPARPRNREVFVEIPEALLERARGRLEDLKRQGIITEH